jgi:hypothetical protein
MLEKIPSRTIRDGFERIVGDGDKLKGVIKRMLKQYEKRAHDAFKKWKQWLADSKSRGLLNAIKARQLKEMLEKIPSRTIRDGFERVVGDGSKLKGVIKRMLKQYEKRAFDAFKKWKQWLADSKSRGLLNAIKARELKEKLERIPSRTIRDGFERIVGDGNKLKVFMKKMAKQCEKKGHDAFKKMEAMVS